MLHTLAQELTFTQQYFSYFVLGLVMCFGYIVWRLFSKPKQDHGDHQGTELMLREAEREARARAAARRLGQEEEPDESGLAPPPQAKDARPDAGTDEPAAKRRPASPDDE